MKVRLKVGEALVKLRGGASKRVTVAQVLRTALGGRAQLASEAKQNTRGNNARQWWVPLGDDGLPEGYRRAES